MTLFAACAEEGSTELEGEISDRQRVIGVGYCPPHLCGLNSDLAGAISFDTKGAVPNAEMRLVAAYGPSGEEHTVRVVRDNIELAAGDAEPLLGAALVGSRLVFEHVSDGLRTTLHLDGFTPQALRSYNNPGVAYSSYRFSYHDEGEPEDVRHPLCGDFPWDEDYEIGQIVSADALVIQSESFDWRGHALQDIGDPFQWATLGCMGGAYAKKVLMGYDPHHPKPDDTTLGENEAMLRLLTARYCDGENHTVPNTPIRWENDRGWSSLEGDAGDGGLALEALWTQDGAVCLNEPRVVERSEVEADCGPIPRCDDFDPADYHLASYRVLD